MIRVRSYSEPGPPPPFFAAILKMKWSTVFKDDAALLNAMAAGDWRSMCITCNDDVHVGLTEQPATVQATEMEAAYLAD